MSATDAPALSTTESLLVVEALISHCQQPQSPAVLPLHTVDWTPILAILHNKTHSQSPSPPMSPEMVQSSLTTILSAHSLPIEPSLSSLQSLYDRLKQQRIAELKTDYATASKKYSDGETMLASLSRAAPMHSSLGNSVAMMSPLPHSVASHPPTPICTNLPSAPKFHQQSPLPGTPGMAPSTPASSASIADSVSNGNGMSLGQPSFASTIVTPPPPLRRTITDVIAKEQEESMTGTPPLSHTASDTQSLERGSLNNTAPALASMSSSPIVSPIASPSSQSSSPSQALTPAQSPLSKSLLLSLLALLQRHPDSEPFLEPVNPADAPGYFDTIKTPMDFSTIQARIGEGSVTTPYQLHQLMLQVFRNAYAYNDRKTTFYKMARNLDSFAGEVFKRYFPGEDRFFKINSEAKKAGGRPPKNGTGLTEISIQTPRGDVASYTVSELTDSTIDLTDVGDGVTDGAEEYGSLHASPAHQRKSTKSIAPPSPSAVTLDTPAIRSATPSYAGSRKRLAEEKAETPVGRSSRVKKGEAADETQEKIADSKGRRRSTKK